MVLPQTQFFSSKADGDHAPDLGHSRADDLPVYSAPGDIYCGLVFNQPEPSSEEESQPEDRDAPLEDAARGEHEYLHERLREELGREPTEEEIDDWLRQHTEGY